MSRGLIRKRSGLAVPAGAVVRGRLELPPSKSLTQRAFNLALLSGSRCVVERPLLAEDTELFVAALADLGIGVVREGEQIRFEPGRGPESGELWCGNNGTMLRFLTAALTTVPGEWLVDGSRRLRQRPIGPLVGCLRSLGADLVYQGEDGFAPVRIRGGSLAGGAVALDASLSSQYASAVMMAALRSQAGVTLQLEGLSSGPYLAMTCALLRSLNCAIEGDVGSATLRIDPGLPRFERFEVEADFSSAAYPAAAAVLTGGSVTLAGLTKTSLQGDREFLVLLEQMGAQVEWSDREVTVRGGGVLRSVDADLSEMPDQVPTLAALAPFAVGRTVIRNVEHLRIKESDRLAAMASELSRLGAVVEESEDGLRIEGSWADRTALPTQPTEVESHGDHRIAMSVALCGLVRPGVVVKAPEVVAKSYPSFWKDLDTLIQE